MFVLFRIINVSCHNKPIDQSLFLAHVEVHFCLVTFCQKCIVDLGFFFLKNNNTKIYSHSDVDEGEIVNMENPYSSLNHK